jgi:Tfp pilus assembly protein PilF
MSSTESTRAALIHAEQMAGHWLALGNEASERGKQELAERHYARAQKWHDKMNRLLGNGDGRDARKTTGKSAEKVN